MNAPFARDYSRFLGKAADDAACILETLFAFFQKNKGEYHACSLNQYAILLMLYAARMRHARDHLMVASIIRSLAHRHRVVVTKDIRELEAQGLVCISPTRRQVSLTEEGKRSIEEYVYTLMWSCNMGGNYHDVRDAHSRAWLQV